MNINWFYKENSNLKMNTKKNKQYIVFILQLTQSGSKNNQSLVKRRGQLHSSINPHGF